MKFCADDFLKVISKPAHIPAQNSRTKFQHNSITDSVPESVLKLCRNLCLNLCWSCVGTLCRNLCWNFALEFRAGMRACACLCVGLLMTFFERFQNILLGGYQYFDNRLFQISFFSQMFSKKCLTLIFQLLLSTGEDFFACQLLVRVPPIEKLCCKTTVV
jgi:hypothetical protein